MWEFYDGVDFVGEPLFVGRGPIGWTGVESVHNDKVSSVRPGRGNCLIVVVFQLYSAIICCCH